jgi:myo-inositol 2-dehydrogenase/D-chiro-inositol 1-dehydrogenase
MPLLRIGLIGCGGIARAAHLPAFDALHALARLVAVADTDPGAAEALAQPRGIPAYADHERLLARDDLDAVVIASPEYAHREQVEAAAARGLHVLCEKPIALTLEDADAMIAACERAGVRLMVGHSRRFTRRYLEARAAIDAGELGAVRLIRENERRPRYEDRPGQYYQRGHWTADPARSRGIVLTAAIHETDLFRWFAGSEPVSVYAEHHSTMQGNASVADFISFTVRFANGCVASSELSRRLPPCYPGFHQLEIYGSSGAYRARDTELASLTHYRRAGASYPGHYGILLQRPEIYIRQLASFIDALQRDLAMPVSTADARAALALALAADRSARSGRSVALSEQAAA